MNIIRENIKRINKTRVAATVLATVLASTVGVTGYVYYDINKELERTQNEASEAYKVIDVLEKEQESLKNNIDDITVKGKELEKKTQDLEEQNKSLESERDKLKEENGEMKSFIEKVERLPKWNPDNVTTPSGVSEIGLELALSGTGLEGLGHAFIDAESQYGINAIFLASLIAQESGWGTSNRAKRDNNLSGYAVYNDTSRGKVFSSKTESVMLTASLLADSYVGKGLVSVGSINKKYSMDSSWTNKITKIANDMVVEANVNNHID